MSCALSASGSPARSCGRRARPRLSLADREEISRGLSVGEPLRAVARRLGRAPSTISREVKANGGRSHYRAVRAHHGAYARARRPKTPKLLAGPLCAQVTMWLEQWWSPEEIARRLRIEFPDDETMHVSHETIYQSLFVQGRGELRRELSRCLRTGRAERRPQGRPERRGQIPNMVMISERPVEVADRAVPGHWEGDLIIGKNNGSAVGTLVERTTRFVLLLHLPDGREAEKVNEAMRKRSPPSPPSWSARSPGTRERSCLPTSRSRSQPVSRCTSATRTARGCAGRTRTRTGYCVSTCRRGPISPCTARRTSPGLPRVSTTVHARRSDS